MVLFFFQAEDGIRDLVRSRGLGDVYKRQVIDRVDGDGHCIAPFPVGAVGERDQHGPDCGGYILSLIHI